MSCDASLGLISFSESLIHGPLISILLEYRGESEVAAIHHLNLISSTLEAHSRSSISSWSYFKVIAGLYYAKLLVAAAPFRI